MRLGIMCSGEGTNFENIVHSCPDHDVVIMVYNKKKCKAKKRAERLDIQSCYSKDEDEIIALFNAYNIDLIVMAGWMRIVSKKFVEAFPGRIINLHPSLLPKYKGLHEVDIKVFIWKSFQKEIKIFLGIRTDHNEVQTNRTEKLNKNATTNHLPFALLISFTTRLKSIDLKNS